MQFYQSLGDGETQSQPAELSRDGALGLFERPEDPADGFGRDAFTAVGDLDNRTTIGGVTSDAHAAAAWCELDRVLEQVPEHLLKAVGVGLNPVGAFLAQVEAKVEVSCRDILRTNFNGVTDDSAQLDLPPVEFDLAADNAGDIEQVVNEPGLKLGIAVDNLQVLLS